MPASLFGVRQGAGGLAGWDVPVLLAFRGGRYGAWMGKDSDRVGRVGVHGVALLTIDELRWKFREQFESDWGIDAIIEVADDDQPTGRLIALQIKSGDARLSHLRSGGRWTMYGEKRHLMHWLEYPIPVLIVLYDPARRTAYWQHVNDRTAEWTPSGFKLDVPEVQRLDVSSRETLRAMAEHWVPHRGTGLSRALQAIALCNAAGVPVPPTEQFWDLFIENKRSLAFSATHAVQTYCLPLKGGAAAVESVVQGHGGPVMLRMDSLRGLWSVSPATTVFVCENPVVIEAAAEQVGPRCSPLVALGGFPSLAVEYLLIGLAACGARLRVHVDHDDAGRRITDFLFARSVRYERWHPNGMGCDSMFEEGCLPQMLDELAVEEA
jgi:hypothetical protein